MKSIFALASGIALLAAASAAEDFPLDLSKAANMDFKDEVAGDGKGGWSDQGPENDMRSFDIKRSDYDGITFKILDPSKNGGRAVISFDNPHLRNGLKDVSLDLSKEKPLVSQLYLMHTSCWNDEPAGTVIGSIEATFEDGTAISKEIKTGVDLTDWWGAGDLENAKVVVKKSNGSANVGVFLSKIELSKTPKRIVSLNFKSNGKALWIIVGATLSQKEIPFTVRRICFQESEEWRPVDMSDIQVKKGSALDLSGIVENGPAGKHGRLIVSKSGDMAFQDSPDTPRRFRGSNSFWTLKKLDGKTKEETRERMAKFAELFRRSGYDIIRPLPIDAYLMGGAKADAEYNPEKLDNADWFISRLKENGIYIYLSIAAYNLGRADGQKGWLEVSSVKSKMFLGDPESRARWKACAENLLNHVNPYTGAAWKDEAAIAVVEPYNEQEFGLFKLDKIDEETRSLYEAKWGAWLKARFGTPEKLAIAGKDDKEASRISSFDSVKLPTSSGGFLVNEFILFRQSLAMECLSWYTKALRDIGYKGLISQYNMAKGVMYSAVRAECCDAISNDGYFAHPSDVTRPGSRCPQDSSAGQAGSYWRGIAANRFDDRPFLVNEHKHAFWNGYRHENALLFPAYSALQGFDAVMVHCDPALLEAEPNFDFITSYDPVSIADEFVGACLYRRGDVKRSEKDVELRIPLNFVMSSCNGERAVSSEQSKISLLTGFSIAIDGANRPPNLPKTSANPNLVIGPDTGALVGGSDWYQSVEEAKGAKFNLKDFTATLKAKGILPDSNISDTEKGIFQSDTGEIVMRTKENLIKVVTPKTEGVSLEAGKMETLGCLNILGSSVPASISACSIDGKPLATSSRIVLVYATDAMNSDMELTQDKGTLIKLGKLPVLLRAGKLDASLKLDSAQGMKLYALGIDGSRKETLPLEVKGGELKIQIDTAKLKNGATPFFEISRD